MSVDDVWANANPDAGPEEITLEPPEDGKHSALLVEGFAGVGKDSGNPFVSVVFQTPATGYKWKVLGGFKSQGQANMTKKLCRDLGVAVDSISFDQLADALAAKAGSYYSLTVKTSGQFRDTYVDGPASGGIKESDLASPPIGEPVSVPTDDSHVPF